MASLQELHLRQRSVKSTRKITQAMKMIAAAKLRKAQERAESGRPYADLMSNMVSGLLDDSALDASSSPDLLLGKSVDKSRMIVLVTSDRGLCGGFNSSVVRRARLIAREYKKSKKNFRFFCIGKKGYSQLKFEFGDYIHEYHSIPDKPPYDFASKIGARLVNLFDDNTFDRCVLVYNRFVSAMTQEIVAKYIIPLKPPSSSENNLDLLFSPSSNNSLKSSSDKKNSSSNSLYEYEPGQGQILEDLLPKNISVQLYSAILESAAGEQGARMTAMDSATRNAGEMMRNLQLEYNRTRQAHITRELIEIISGADAL